VASHAASITWIQSVGDELAGHASNLRVVSAGLGPGGSVDLPPGSDVAAFNSGPEGRRRLEIFTSGIDEAFQSVGGDPYLGTSNFGLRVPTKPTPDPFSRYLFNLASFTLAEGQRSYVIGYRMFWSLGVKLGEVGGPFTIIEQPVDQPGFYLPDGNVSWHMHRIAPGEVPIPNQGPISPLLNSFAFRMSENPALLYEFADAGGTFYVNLSSYVPPNLGRPWGTMLRNNLGTMYDQRTQWRTQGSWRSMHMPVDGPCTVAFFASVQQTDPSPDFRFIPTPPSPFFPNGLSDEWQFVFNFPFATAASSGAIIWRVAGALIVEDA
jgi:hypothetical protein